MSNPAAGPPAEEQAPIPESSLRPLAVGLIAGVLAVAFESMAVATAMPAAAADLGKLQLYAWAFSLFVVGMLTGSVVAGRAADERGVLVPLTIGMVVFASGLFVSGTATTMEQLLVGRLVQGLGGGALNVGLVVVLATAFPEHRRATMMTFFSAAWVLPAFLGPPLAGWVTRTWSWHWVFFGIVPLVLLSGLLALGPLLRLQRARVPTQAERSGVPAWVGLVLGGAAVLLQYAGQRVSQHRDVWVLLSALGALALLGVGLPRLMPRGFLRFGRGLPAVLMTRAVVAGAFFATEAFVPLMMVQQRGQQLTTAGVMLTVGSTGWFIGSWLQSRTWLRIPRHQLVVIGSVSVAVGITGIASVAMFPQLWVGVAWLVWPFAGLGMGLLITGTGLAQITLSSDAEQGRNASALQSGESLGNSLLSGLAGTIFAFLHLSASGPITFGALMFTMVAVAGFGALVATRIGPLTR